MPNPLLAGVHLVNAQALWTDGGDFRLVDADDANAVLAEVRFCGPLRTAAQRDPCDTASTILEAMVSSPRPAVERVIRLVR